MRDYLLGKKGIALITTLMIVSLVVAVVVEFNRTAVAEIEVSKNFSDDKKITYLAISGVNAVKDLLMLEGVYTKGTRFWKSGPTAGPISNPLAPLSRRESWRGSSWMNASKINVNNLVGEKGQFRRQAKANMGKVAEAAAIGLTNDQVNMIIDGVKDWIDKDDEVTGIYGAEDASYRARGYRCKNDSLYTLEELLLINGMTKEIFYGDGRNEGIHSYFTVFGGSEININTAPIPILMALSDEMTEEIAKKMDEFRRDEATAGPLQTRTGTGGYGLTRILCRRIPSPFHRRHFQSI